MPLCHTTIRIALLALILLDLAACGPAAVPPRRGDPEPAALSALDINSATSEELAALPGIGPATARKILEHRKKFGPFFRKEHLMLVNGISEKKYRAMAPFVAVR